MNFAFVCVRAAPWSVAPRARRLATRRIQHLRSGPLGARILRVCVCAVACVVVFVGVCLCCDCRLTDRRAAPVPPAGAAVAGRRGGWARDN